MKQLSEAQKKIVTNYLDEKIKAEIHLAGVRDELNKIMQHSSEHGYPVEANLINWMPTVLKMTMQRQRGIDNVMKMLGSSRMRDVLKGEVVADYAPSEIIAPGLVQSAGGPDQDLYELFAEVGDVIIARLDNLATMLRKTLGDLQGEG